MCSNNVILRLNEGKSTDYISPTILSSNILDKCDKKSLLYLVRPDINREGWFGGNT